MGVIDSISANRVYTNLDRTLYMRRNNFLHLLYVYCKLARTVALCSGSTPLALISSSKG